MTSWWSATAGALVVVAALGNGSRLFIPHPNQERQISSWTPAGSSARALRTGQVFLFDSHRQAVAYLDQDGSRTIYLWSGEPVAYLVDESVYAFNGTHLGWYKNGVIVDHDGNLVVSPAVAFRKPVQPAPARGLRGAMPSKAPMEPKPREPSLGVSWSDLSAREFFLPVVN